MTAPLFKTKLCASLPNLFSSSRLWVDVAVYSDFTGLATAAPALSIDASGNVQTAWGDAPGAKGSVVVIRMAYMWPLVAMPLGTLGNIAATVHQMTVNSVLRTEAYQ